MGVSVQRPEHKQLTRKWIPIPSERAKSCSLAWDLGDLAATAVKTVLGDFEELPLLDITETLQCEWEPYQPTCDFE